MGGTPSRERPAGRFSTPDSPPVRKDEEWGNGRSGGGTERDRDLPIRPGLVREAVRCRGDPVRQNGIDARY